MERNTILITGGSGFLGEALIKRLYPNKIRIVGRNEGLLGKMKDKFPDIEVVTGDISDECVARKSMDGVKEVYHLAAYKHVGMAEENPMQCVKSNIIGSMNILKISYEIKPNFVVGISTDKAAQVSGVYGATKMLMESLFKEAERTNKDTNYRIVRYGNVLYSTGSVLCKWKERMMRGEDVIITDPNATRFFWTVDEAVDLIFNCLNSQTDATPMMSKMKSMSMGDLLEAMMQKYGRVGVKTIGLQAGENLHETIDGKIYSNNVERFTIDEIKEKI